MACTSTVSDGLCAEILCKCPRTRMAIEVSGRYSPLITVVVPDILSTNHKQLVRSHVKRLVARWHVCGLIAIWTSE
jgi:hypothetical protein